MLFYMTAENCFCGWDWVKMVFTMANVAVTMGSINAMPNLWGDWGICYCLDDVLLFLLT